MYVIIVCLIDKIDFKGCYCFGFECIEWIEVFILKFGFGEVFVKVKVVGINCGDLL